MVERLRQTNRHRKQRETDRQIQTDTGDNLAAPERRGRGWGERGRKYRLTGLHVKEHTK